jgi:hypothetical protein
MGNRMSIIKPDNEGLFYIRVLKNGGITELKDGGEYRLMPFTEGIEISNNTSHNSFKINDILNCNVKKDILYMTVNYENVQREISFNYFKKEKLLELLRAYGINVSKT